MERTFYHHPAVRKPTLEDIKTSAKSVGLILSAQELQEHTDLVESMLEPYNEIADLPDVKLDVKYPRVPGYRPIQEENKYNAWYYKSDVPGASEGLLSGKSIVIKDNIPVAGVPMMYGSTLLEGYTPDIDATVVTRILDAGGRIKGKAVCENMCAVGESYSAATGPVLNPHDTQYSAGGSSSGCAALIAAGEVDMAVGGDQGGSVRIPAARCGIVGLKPTFGLVPYTGALGIEPSTDYLGPMGRTVKDVALLLEVIAGYDQGLDPRQTGGEFTVPSYTKKLAEGISGMNIGLLWEAFEASQPSVRDDVMEAAQRCFKLKGASIEQVSIPEFKIAKHLASQLILNGATSDFVLGIGYGGMGYYPTSLLEACRKAALVQINDAPHNSKTGLLFSDFLLKNYGRKFFYKAMNQRPIIKQAFDKVLDQYEVLVMPTLTNKTPLLEKANLTLKGYSTKALNMNGNTCVFNYTGHPAITVNINPRNSDHMPMSQSLPIGMMIVGKHFQDEVVLKAAHAFESALNS